MGGSGIATRAVLRLSTSRPWRARTRGEESAALADLSAVPPSPRRVLSARGRGIVRRHPRSARATAAGAAVGLTIIVATVLCVHVIDSGLRDESAQMLVALILGFLSGVAGVTCGLAVRELML